MNNLIPLRDFTAERIPADAIIAKNVFSDLEAINPLAERSVMGSTTSPTFDPDIEKANQRAKSVQEPLYDFSLAENIRYQGGSEFSRLTPTADLEREYSMLKGGRWARKWSEFTDNFDYSFIGRYESMGASINAAEDELVGLNFDKIWGALSTENITDSAYKKTQRDRIREVTQPFYRYYDQGEAPIYSPEGMLGDLVPSLGFAAGGAAGMATDLIGSTIIRSAIATGVGAIAVGALYGVGAPALTNDFLRDKIGERSADIMLGYLTSAGATAILGGIGNGALKGGVKGIDEAVKATQLANKESANIYKAIVESADDVIGMGDNIISGGSKASNQMGAAFKVLRDKASMLNKKTIGAQITGHLALGYLTSGGEAAMEATNAQADYIDERYNEIVQGENRIPTEKELADIKEESKGVLGSVNKWNRVVLTVSNAIGMRGILADPLKDGFIKMMPIMFKDNIAGDFTTKKALWKLTKDWLVDSSKEGLEEMSQFGITEGAKEYYEKELEDRDFVSTLTDGVLGAVSSEGLYEGLLGAITGGGMTAFRTGKQLAFKSKEDTWQKALFGYDNKSVNAVADNLNKQFKNLKSIFDASNTTGLDGEKLDSKTVQSIVQDKSFNLLYSLYEAGLGSKVGLILDGLSSSMDAEHIQKFYGDLTDPKTNTKVSQLNEEQTKAFFYDQVRKYDKEAKQLATDVFNIGEYFADPFSLSTMEKLAENSIMTKLFRDKVKREQGNDITGTYKDTAFQKRQLNIFAKDQVKIAARRMFMARKYQKEFDSSLETLKQYHEKHPNTNLFQKITINGQEQSILDFVTPHEWGSTEFTTMIDNRITELEAQIASSKALSEGVASDSIEGITEETNVAETKELDGLKNLKTRIAKYGNLEDMLMKEAMSMFELDSLDNDLASEFRKYEEDLDNDIREVQDNAAIYEVLRDVFVTKKLNKNSLGRKGVKEYLNSILGDDYKKFSDDEIRLKIGFALAVADNKDAWLAQRKLANEDRKNKALDFYKEKGSYSRKSEDPKRIAEYQENVIRAYAVLNGLSNIKNSKQALVVTEQFEQKKNDPSYKKQYLANMFKIYEDSVKKKENNRTNKEDAAKGVTKYIQPGDNNRTSLSRYTISERGIFYKNDKGEEVPVSNSPTDFTKLEAHIKGTDAEGLKAFEEFEKDQRKERGEKIAKLEEEIKNLESSATPQNVDGVISLVDANTTKTKQIKIVETSGVTAVLANDSSLEDAVAFNISNKSFAVADGVSNAIFTADLSNVLVNLFVDNTIEDFKTQVNDLSEKYFIESFKILYEDWKKLTDQEVNFLSTLSYDSEEDKTYGDLAKKWRALIQGELYLNIGVVKVLQFLESREINQKDKFNFEESLIDLINNHKDTNIIALHRFAEASSTFVGYKIKSNNKLEVVQVGDSSITIIDKDGNIKFTKGLSKDPVTNAITSDLKKQKYKITSYEIDYIETDTIIISTDGVETEEKLKELVNTKITNDFIKDRSNKGFKGDDLGFIIVKPNKIGLQQVQSTEPNPLTILLKQKAIETAKKEYDEAIEEYKKDNDLSSKVTIMLDNFKEFKKEVNESKLKSVPLQESEIGGLRDMGLNDETLTYISMFKESGLLTVEC